MDLNSSMVSSIGGDREDASLSASDAESGASDALNSSCSSSVSSTKITVEDTRRLGEFYQSARGLISCLKPFDGDDSKLTNFLKKYFVMDKLSLNYSYKHISRYLRKLHKMKTK